MSLARIRDEYRVPSRLGAQVTIDALGMPGTITGSHLDFITVRAETLTIHVHPTELTFHQNRSRAGATSPRPG